MDEESPVKEKDNDINIEEFQVNAVNGEEVYMRVEDQEYEGDSGNARMQGQGCFT